jgi:hypothetical protein
LKQKHKCFFLFFLYRECRAAANLQKQLLQFTFFSKCSILVVKCYVRERPFLAGANVLTGGKRRTSPLREVGAQSVGSPDIKAKLSVPQLSQSRSINFRNASSQFKAQNPASALPRSAVALTPTRTACQFYPAGLAPKKRVSLRVRGETRVNRSY